MRAAFWRICSGVSNITPAGAALNNGLVGLAEWHTEQRSWITLCTLSKLGPALDAWTGASAGFAAAGLAPPQMAVSGSGWYSMVPGALATSGALGICAGPVT